MARIQDRQRAIELRKQGKTYSEIKQELGVAKSTLSDWLSKFPLTDNELNRLKISIKNRKYIAVEKIRNTKIRKKEQRIDRIYSEEMKKILPLSSRELYIAGLLLYWGEGAKGIFNSAIRLNNTDPQVVKFYYYWLQKIGIPKEKIRVSVHLYADMNVEKTLNYWSKNLSISRNQFIKPYIKKSERIKINHKGFGHGTCGIAVYDARLKERIMLGIQVISDYYSGKI